MVSRRLVDRLFVAIILDQFSYAYVVLIYV